MSADFTNEDAAIARVEASRWPNGEVVCPHCGSVNVHRMAGKTQAGYFLCNDCRDKFTCRTGTVMERSHIPIHKCLFAIHLMASSKKDMSAHQLHRMIGVRFTKRSPARRPPSRVPTISTGAASISRSPIRTAIAAATSMSAIAVP